MGTDFPLRVIIDKVNIDTSISNPTSADISILNNALLKGAVRYPGSGTLGHGNMFIFGHSTGIRVVNNQAYKAFNNLKDVEIGDTIRIQSIDKEYNYKVTSVSMVDSEEAWVTFSQDKNMVTLSTCNVFGQKQDRYVVEAIFVKSIDLQ
jgi:LPXTG-site transpeptidase (sortase) family protein